MKPQEFIDKINNAASLGEVLDFSEWKKQYGELAKILHPDVCAIPGAAAAFARLNGFKENWEKGYRYNDDAGEVQVRNKTVTGVGEPALLLQSYRNYGYLKSLKSPAAQHFKRYLPESMTLDGGSLLVELHHRAVPLSGLTLTQGHANWIMSRLLEFSTWLAQEGCTHCGINPESVLLIPETHGIVLSSFYHLTPRGGTVKTIAAKYRNWYPDALFVNKMATPNVDIELCKRSIATILGDPSGLGMKLKKTHLAAFIDFLLTSHTDAFECYDQYRKLLKTHFSKNFLPLNL